MKDKITAESFQAIVLQANLRVGLSEIAMECFELHQKAIQQILEEGGGELKTQKEWSAWYDGYFEEHDEIPDSLRTFEWMRSEASKIIFKKDDLIRQGRDSVVELLRQVKQLEALNTKQEKDIQGLKEDVQFYKDNEGNERA